ncbi:hypothetical protein MY3296_010021 [Beauveria thailandica]
MITALQMYAQHERGQLATWTRADYARNHVEDPTQEEALDALQQRLRAEPLPEPTAEERSALLAGNFDGIKCIAVLTALMEGLHISKKPKLRARADLGRRQGMTFTATCAKVPKRWQ